MVQADLRESPVGVEGGGVIRINPTQEMNIYTVITKLGLPITHRGHVNGPLVTLIISQRGHSSRPCPKKLAQVLQGGEVRVQLGPQAALDGGG